MPDPDAVSLQSCNAPLLEIPESKAAAFNNGFLGRFRDKDQRPKYFQGWRMGITLCAATASSILTVNVVLIVFAFIKYGLHDGLGTLQEGNCHTTKDLSLWLHLAINVLSTLLLGASNYGVQCLTSPTREEIDTAHGQHVWLDIGVPSVRNLGRIALSKTALWYLLAASSIPLHLLWNSAVFSTLSAQDYAVFAASPDLFNVAGLNWSAPIPGVNQEDYTLGSFLNASSWQKLDNYTCIQAYKQKFVSNRGDVLVLISGMNASMPIELLAESNSWYDVCGPRGCDPDQNLATSANWMMNPLGYDNGENYLIQYCLSKPVEERCRVQFSIVIMGVVIGCNFVKAWCLFSTLWIQKSQPLVTLGDSIDSFLDTVDPTTENKCLGGNVCFSRKQWGKGPVEWQGQRYRWFSGASVKRWVTCNLL